MKALKIIALSVALLVGISAAVNAQETKKESKKKTEEVTFKVSMNCESCKARIEKTIPFEKGVKDLTVDLADKTVKIKYDTRKTDEAKLKKAIEDLDYTCEKAEGDK